MPENPKSGLPKGWLNFLSWPPLIGDPEPILISPTVLGEFHRTENNEISSVLRKFFCLSECKESFSSTFCLYYIDFRASSLSLGLIRLVCKGLIERRVLEYKIVLWFVLKKQSPAPSGTRARNLLITRHVLYRCVTTTVLLVPYCHNPGSQNWVWSQ